MFKALLFDLDGTLLDIDMDYFLKHYFKKMMEMAALSGYANVEKLVGQVYKSTGAMIANQDPRLRNEEVFKEDFFSKWEYPRKEFEGFFDRFYAEGFPQLKEKCRPFSGVPEMMEKVFKKGMKVVIATNAVFPFTALQQRLDWAGVGSFDYELVTSYELMHFCKPHHQYYEEIAGIIGENPQDCLMVGNDVGEDLPAKKTGMKTFLVEDMLIDNGSTLQADWRGRLQDLFAFIEEL